MIYHNQAVNPLAKLSSSHQGHLSSQKGTEKNHSVDIMKQNEPSKNDPFRYQRDMISQDEPIYQMNKASNVSMPKTRAKSHNRSTEVLAAKLSEAKKSAENMGNIIKQLKDRLGLMALNSQEQISSSIPVISPSQKNNANATLELSPYAQTNSSDVYPREFGEIATAEEILSGRVISPIRKGQKDHHRSRSNDFLDSSLVTPKNIADFPIPMPFQTESPSKRFNDAASPDRLNTLNRFSDISTASHSFSMTPQKNHRLGDIPSTNSKEKGKDPKILSNKDISDLINQKTTASGFKQVQLPFGNSIHSSKEKVRATPMANKSAVNKAQSTTNRPLSKTNKPKQTPQSQTSSRPTTAREKFSGNKSLATTPAKRLRNNSRVESRNSSQEKGN